MTHTCLSNLAFFLDLLVEPDSTSFFTSPLLKSLLALWDLFDSNPLHSLVESNDSLKTRSTNLQICWLCQSFATMSH
jgi:hypothetical protein